MAGTVRRVNLTKPQTELDRSMNKTERITKMLADQEAARLLEPPPAVAARAVDPMMILQGMIQMNGRTGIAYTHPKNIAPDPTQPRKAHRLEGLEADAYHAELVRLGGSLNDRQVQPIVVEPDLEQMKWSIVCGERRWMAATAAKLEKIACVFLPKKLTPFERKKMQGTENLHRVGFKGIEAAELFRDVMALGNLTQQQCAAEFKVSPATVSEALKLLGLPKSIQDNIIAGKIPPSSGTELAKLNDPEEQAEMAEQIVNGEMSRDKVADAVKKKKAARKTGNGKKKLPKSVTLKTASGYIVTVSHRHALGDDDVDTALEEAVEMRRQKRSAA